MKAYRLIKNRMMVMFGFDLHMTSTSKGRVRRYSYAYQAKIEMSNASVGIFHKLTQSCDGYMGY